MHIASAREAASRAALVPAVYQIFDLLAFDGIDATPLPYVERRRLLAEVVVAGPSWSVPGHHVGGGRALLDSVDELGMEGVLAKRLDSTYEPGRRSRSWLKVKVRRHQELVVGGWAEGEGRRAGTLGALLVGYHDDPADRTGDPAGDPAGDAATEADGSAGAPGPLRYAGRVGTGFTDHELDRLAGLLEPLAIDRCPFEPEPPALHRRGARWVAPELVVEVAYGEWTEDHVLRHPAYLGQRTDKDPGDVTRAP
jgi:bifunctional non-homologous end joining protein LigD